MRSREEAVSSDDSVKGHDYHNQTTVACREGHTALEREKKKRGEGSRCKNLMVAIEGKCPARKGTNLDFQGCIPNCNSSGNFITMNGSTSDMHSNVAIELRTCVECKHFQ